MDQEQTLLGDRHRRHVGRSHPCGVATTAADVGLLSPIGLAERISETTDRAAPVVLSLELPDDGRHRASWGRGRRRPGNVGRDEEEAGARAL